jgi:hypothetical protein
MPTVIVQPSSPTVTVTSGSAPPQPATPTTYGSVILAGDLGGTAAAPVVAKIQGTTVQAPPGVNSKFLAGDGSWQTASAGSGVQVGGDIGGTNTIPLIVSTHLSAALPINQGGTAATTQQAAINSLTGTQSAGKYLRSDGTNATLATIQTADVPVLNQNTTGTAAGLSSTLAIGSGGTGQVTQQAAINALTGTQSAGTYLRSDGANAALAAIQAADVPTLNQNTTGTAGNVSGVVGPGNGGTGQTSAAAAYNALSPMTTLGDLEYESGANTAARLPGNTTANKQFLTQTGTGSVSAAPAWGAIAPADLAGSPATGQILTTTSPSATAWAYYGSSNGPVNPSAARLGLVSESISIYQCNLKGNLASGTLSLALVWWPAGKTLSKLSVYVATAGTTLTGTNSLGLYTSSGTLLTTTGDMTAAFGATGWQESTLTSSQTPTVDTIYYVGVLTHAGGTLPAIQAFNLVSAFGVINGVYPAITFAAQANHASFTPSAGTPVNGAYWFGAR